MRSMNENTKIEEYRHLQEEHKKNRGYIFERPLLIIGIVAAAFQYMFQYQSSAQGPELLTSLLKLFVFPFLIFLLYYNLNFTKDKLISDSRIVAYIQLFHEDCLVPYWIGWETSLRYYRMWMNVKIENNDLQEWLRNNIKDQHISTPKGLFFYAQIYYIHIIFIFFLFIIWMVTVYYVLPIISYILLLISLYLLRYFLNKENPLHFSKYSNHIEEQRVIWLDVYQTYIFNHSKSDMLGIITYPAKTV